LEVGALERGKAVKSGLNKKKEKRNEENCDVRVEKRLSRASLWWLPDVGAFLPDRGTVMSFGETSASQSLAWLFVPRALQRLQKGDVEPTWRPPVNSVCFAVFVALFPLTFFLSFLFFFGCFVKDDDTSNFDEEFTSMNVQDSMSNKSGGMVSSEVQDKFKNFTYMAGSMVKQS
jgi:hypothetical protein